MDIFIDLLPLIVGTSGIIICIIALWFMDKVLDLDGITILEIVVIIWILTIAGVKVSQWYQNTYSSPKKDDSYYVEIENLSKNGYTVYVDGSAVDFDKIVISDYLTDKIHINDELKEIYISK